MSIKKAKKIAKKIAYKLTFKCALRPDYRKIMI